MIKVLSVFGTRPEAIKMCPVVNELNKHPEIISKVCVTGQHREMLQSVLEIFNIEPDYNLEIMIPNQTLFDITIMLLEKIRPVLESVNPDIVLVHGDTTTAAITSLACYYLKIPVGHVEAGLRTNDIYSPFPEEYNRQAIGLVAAMHFAPTPQAKANLLSEGKKAPIFVTGNTAIDALQTTVRADYHHEVLTWAKGKRMLLLTAHRRENLGEPMRSMFEAIKNIVNKYDDVCVVYPVHMNPKVREIANEVLGNIPRIRMIEPLDVVDFHNFMQASYLILTDSGGIQEEAPSLGKPVLVMRDTTERPEGVEFGTLKLVGTNCKTIFDAVSTLLDDTEEYKQMSIATNPFGDGTASKQIVEHIIKHYQSK